MLTKELKLSKYPKYSDIKEIKKLDIFGEDIKNISIISKMPNLEILALSSNKISSLYPLSQCLNMREIYLRNNNIYSFEELHHLKVLSNLKVLWLEGNPISKDFFYREKVIDILPQIQNLDNKKILFNKIEKKRGQSEEQKLIKNECDYNANIIKSNNKKKIVLKRVFSYFEPSNDGVDEYIETSKDSSAGKNKPRNYNNYRMKKFDLSEFKIKFSNKVKSVEKDRKKYKKIKLKIKTDNNNLCNNLMINNYSGNGPRISTRKLTVDAYKNPKPKVKENITVQNSIIHQNSYLKEKSNMKYKNLTLFGNKDLYRYKNDDKIRININNYENESNNNLIKSAYLLVDKMNIQELLCLREFINKKISTLNK